MVPAPGLARILTSPGCDGEEMLPLGLGQILLIPLRMDHAMLTVPYICSRQSDGIFYPPLYVSHPVHSISIPDLILSICLV